ncbi:MAG: 2-amino-4-hydroxy-6-hydroxymethyldihydropteridine diphosphokinase [Cyclobacteriaceae bacterium]|nr:2-amino-4-hydroxy-6-hydroxymethyldihydropteridine diphosphokinase [Cyclobacteriaceae bacterium]
MVSAYLLLGSNLGNRAENLLFARREISRLCGQIITASSVYETEPWGKPEQPWFYNQVIEIRTHHQPDALLTRLQFIENELGRTRPEKWGPRTLDIDILYYGSFLIQTDNLIIPPPTLPERRFALLPFAEIAPNLVHPSMQCTIKQLLERCPDELTARKII